MSAGQPQRAAAGLKYPVQVDSQTLVGQLVEPALEIDATSMRVRRTVAMSGGTAQSQPRSGFDKARSQADCGFAIRQLQRAAERLMELAGPAAFAASSPLQRLRRDLSLGTRRTALNAMQSSGLHGRALLGQNTSRTLLADIRPTA